jgi:membrane peptidoglycan carboxypeptidase
MWATVDGKAVKKDLTGYKGTDFGDEVGFGQYPITVLDHANGQATFAARGYSNPVHFVSEVYEKDADTAKEKKVYGEKIAPKRIPGFTDGISDDLNWVLEHIPKHNSETLNGWEAAGKTGSWEYLDKNGNTAGNAHAWMVGYTMSDPSKKSPGLATAVWIGNKADEQPIKNSKGQTIIGARQPGLTWQYFMNNALKDVGMPKVKFNEPKYTGDKQEGTGNSPAPTQPSIPPDNNQPGGNDNNNPNPNPSTSNSGGTGGGGPTNPRSSRSPRN